MSGALCMELLTSEGWNPVNDIESVIVSIRSLLVVGGGRLSAAAEMSNEAREAALAAAKERNISEDDSDGESEPNNRKRHCHADDKDENEDDSLAPQINKIKTTKTSAGKYSASEAKAAYSQLSAFHKEKGWSKSWARKG
jgi:ubiquitin-conjugating enzyme E2 Q